MRLFIAVPVPAEAAAALQRVAAAAAEELPLRLLSAVSLHLTLIFLGERNGKQAEQIIHFMKEAGVTAAQKKAVPPLISVERLAVYPQGSAPPRVLVAEAAAGREQLGQLHRILIEKIPAQSNRNHNSSQPFRPHITLARWNRKAGSRIKPPRTLDRHAVGISFKPQQLVLYRSQLSREGASYDPLFTVELTP